VADARQQPASAATRFTARELEIITRIARSVRYRRRALGLRTGDLDVAAQLPSRTVERIERVDPRRSVRPDDPVVRVVLMTLGDLEAMPEHLRPQPAEGFDRPKLRIWKPSRQRFAATEPTTLEAHLRRCPDHDVWITQAGCAAHIDAKDPVCRSLRSGRGCRGVKHRHTLERKTVQVEYTPPSLDGE